MLRFRNLGSGSAGNATLVEARCGTTTTRLLVDCGLGIRQLQARLVTAGVQPEELDGIFVTHEHSDHIGSARAVALRWRVPVWMSAGTHAAVGAPDFEDLLRLVADGAHIALGALELRPFTVPHDAREPLQLRCSDGANHLGILTDLGHATQHVLQQLAGCQALLLESNHDPDLLAASAYPPFLKARVSGKLGHLSNPASAAIAAALWHPRLQRVVAAHLSEKNNRADLVRVALGAALGCAPVEVGVADQREGTDWITV